MGSESPGPIQFESCRKYDEMFFDSAATTQWQQIKWSDDAMNIEVTKLNPQDEIIIRTKDGEYRFAVTDSELSRGFLTGGVLGSRHRDGFLAGVILPETLTISNSKTLETGARAIFYLDSKRGVDRLITSMITELAIAAGSTAALRAIQPNELSMVLRVSELR